MKPIIRPATREDIKQFDRDGDPSVKAWCMELDGQVIALGGIARLDGRWLAFTDFKPEARKHKITLARAARKFFDELEGIKFVYAGQDEKEPTSLRLMTWLGFSLDPKTNKLYRWGG